MSGALPATGLDGDAWLAWVRASVSDPPLGRIGPYELMEEIGRGGQGIVFRARQPQTGREVAIKRLSAGVFATPDMRARFEREIEWAAALDHPAIVTVFGSDVADGQPLLVMQWVDGVHFDQWARPAGGAPRSVREILLTFCTICSAIEHAHQRGVIHRDLKPSNILVDREDRPHVLDFGLVRLMHSGAGSLTLTGNFVGTPAYAAPEQFTSEREAIDVRTDVYALGAVLFAALTGRVIIELTPDIAGIIHAIRTHEPPAPSALDKRLDREIDAIVLKAVAKDPGARYASVAELRADIERYLSGDRVLAHPPSAVYRLRKFVRVHRVMVAAVASFASVLLGATATSIAFYVHAADARQRAETTLVRLKSVNEFLNNMLRRADLPLEKGRNLTVREALDAAAQELAAGEGTLDPEVGADLHMTIGLTYSSLDVNTPDAEKHFRQAFELRRRVHGEVHSSVLDCAYQLAKIARNAGRWHEAESLFELIIQNRRAQDGERSPYVAQALTSLGIMQRFQGHYAEAEISHREALAIYHENFGDDDNVADVLGNLGVLMDLQGRHAEAEPLFRRAIDLQRNTLGTDHKGFAGKAIPAAMTFWKVGKRDEASAILNEGVATMERLGLAESPLVAYACHIRAEWALEEGDSQRAESFARDAIHVLRKLENPRGVYQARLASFIATLARALQHQGRAQEALQAASEARDVLELDGTAENVEIATACSTVGQFYYEQDQFAAAEALLLRADEITTKVAAHEPNEAAQRLSREGAEKLTTLYEKWHAREPEKNRAANAEAWRRRASTFGGAAVPYGESRDRLE